MAAFIPMTDELAELVALQRFEAAFGALPCIGLDMGVINYSATIWMR